MGFKFEKISILVVEDTEPMLKLVETVLDTLGVGTIHTAKNGEQGFEVFCQENPDIVITDWHMEPVPGLELIEQIRNNPKSPNKTAPVIMMTGYSALDRVKIARDIGSTEFLVKPFSANGLARRIAYVINKPRDFIKTTAYFGPDRRRKQDENYSGSKKRISDTTFTANAQ